MTNILLMSDTVSYLIEYEIGCDGCTKRVQRLGLQIFKGHIEFYCNEERIKEIILSDWVTKKRMGQKKQYGFSYEKKTDSVYLIKSQTSIEQTQEVKIEITTIMKTSKRFLKQQSILPIICGYPIEKKTKRQLVSNEYIEWDVEFAGEEIITSVAMD